MFVDNSTRVLESIMEFLSVHCLFKNLQYLGLSQQNLKLGILERRTACSLYDYAIMSVRVQFGPMILFTKAIANITTKTVINMFENLIS
jgi:hypothetical protein